MCNIITHFPLFFWYLLSKILSFSKHMKMCNLNYIRKSPFFKVGTPLFSLANVISSQLAGSVQKQLPFFSIPTLFGNIAESPPSTTTRTRAHTLRAHTRRAHAVSTMQDSYAYSRMMSCLYKEKTCNRPDDIMMVSVYNKYQRTPANKRNFAEVNEEE